MSEEFLVLVVEDDVSTRNVIVEVLRDDGLVADVADGYQSGLQAFVPGKYQVAIIDDRLGDGSGTELCRELKALDPDIKLFLFAGASENVRLKALSSGAAKVLQKPYDLSKLAYLAKCEAQRTDAEPGN
ncbi:MAG TPA: response regulator [Blastocatellia bacterium]|nr:response regulator [Blastocatellia bacterium]